MVSWGTFTYTDDGAAPEVLEMQAKAITEELSKQPAGVVLLMFPMIHAMVVAEAKRVFQEAHIRVYVTGAPFEGRGRCSAYAQFVVLYHKIFQARISELFAQLQNISKAVAHPNAQVEEMERWLKTKKDLEQEQETLMADCLLAAAAIVYFSAFPQMYYSQLMAKCSGLCEARHLKSGYRFRVASVLGPRAVEYCAPESELLAPMGLPVLHSHTVDQAVAVEVVAGTDSDRWPLILDPSGIMTQWLRAVLKPHGYLTVRVDQDPVQCAKQLAQAVQAGLAVVLTGLQNSLPAHLFPFLDRQHINKTGKVMLAFPIMLGSEECASIQPHASFRLYMVSGSTGPTLLDPAVFSMATVIDATPSAEMVAAALRPFIMELEKPGPAADLRRHAAEVALYTKMRRTCEAECRASLGEPVALRAQRAKYNVLDSKLFKAQGILAALAPVRDQFSVHSQMASQLYLVMYSTSCGSLTLEKFKETLDIAAKERNMVASTQGDQSIANEDLADQAVAQKMITLYGEGIALRAKADVQTADGCARSAAGTALYSAQAALTTRHASCLPADHRNEAYLTALLSWFSAEAANPAPEALKIMQAQLNVLKNRPTDPKGFVLYQETLLQINQHLSGYIQDLGPVHAQLCIKEMAGEEVDEARSLLDCAKDLQAAAADAELFVQQNIPHLLSELQAQTLTLMVELESSKMPLMEQGSDAALAAIDEYKDRLQSLKMQVESFAGDAANVQEISSHLLLCCHLVDDLTASVT
mmetsp:Transcript_25625/g.46262  ORF Transcript_25625/g.46262 Transcript_25625/m.46262 type:complete len:755 (-) Transcript_25625:697-2961(-)